MRRLFLLVVLVGLLVGGDLYAKRYAERRIAHRIEGEVPGDREADVDIDSFPFLGRLLASGAAGTVRASMDLIRADGLRLTNVHLELKGVEVDRDLLSERQVAVTGIDSGVITADLTTDALTEALGLPLRIRAGTVEVTIGGRSMRAEASVSDNVLRLALAPLPAVTLPVPKTSLVPCATDATIVDDRIRITCILDDVPPALLRVRNDPLPAG